MSGLTELDLDALFAPVADANTLGLAVSGGPDSLALMLLASEWSKGPGRPKFIVYTVDHQLRPEAAAEAAMVEREAGRLGFESRSLRWEGDKPETGVQAAARKARYGLMASAMAADGSERLLTAHHLGDLAETVLMRLAHGSGIEGLRGMDALVTVEGCALFRPLLGMHPEDLREIVEDAGITPASDPSNSDRHYERVRWRQSLPLLEELGIDLKRLGTFARRMADADALIGAETDKAELSLVSFGPEGAQLSHAALVGLHRVVGVRLLARVLGRTGGDRKPHALGAIEALHDKLAQRRELKPTTLHGCIISSDSLTISVRKEGARARPRLLNAN